MKTIEQDRHTILEICRSAIEGSCNIWQGGSCISFEKDKAIKLAQAILPDGKAIIDIPDFEKYEFVRYGFYTSDDIANNCFQYSYIFKEKRCTLNNCISLGFQEPVLIYRMIKKPEFQWPEHLPNGSKIFFANTLKKWIISIGEDDEYYLFMYNIIVRPEDQIEIPKWLEENPEVIVKGKNEN